VEQLVTQDATAESDFDKAVESTAIAEAGLARSEAAIVESQQQVLAAEKTLAYHRARLADTEITVPFDGLIIQRQRDPGDVVVPGSPILELVSLGQLWVSAWVDETEMAHIDVGQPARVVFRSDPERSYPGEVARLGKEADRETREFIVDVHVLELPKNWAVGQRAEVYIETARKDGVALLPAAHVRLREDAAGVFVGLGNRAVWRPLKLGLRSPATIEVVDGLHAGDTVVVPQDPRAELTDGQRIAVP
jgi:HlyD family secretion protein